MTTDWIIAIDLGGTQIRAALGTPEGEIRARAKTETRAEQGPAAVLQRICRTAEQMLPQQGVLRAIGISSVGPLDPFEGVVSGPPNLPGWDAVPLRDVVRAHFGVPTYIGNDANLAGLAEHQFGAGRGCDNMIYMTISTGIGGGIIIGGELYMGRNGLASHIGHMILLADGPLCGCGNRGCLEALASGTAIGREARALAASGRAAAILAAAGGDIAAVDSRAVGVAAAQGDAVAVELLQRAGRYIGIAIASLMHLFNPQRFVLGGGVTRAGELLFEPIRREVPRWTLIPRYWQGVEIIPAALGDDVGLLGALALAAAQEGVA